jgi:iron complex transport system permease protein
VSGDEASEGAVLLASPVRILPRRPVLGLLGLLLAASCLLALGVGAMPIPIVRVVAVLAARGQVDLGVDFSPAEAAVLWSVRLPRLLLGVGVGAGLGVSGAAMQGIFRNPLVDPGLLGVSSGAALGAVSTIVLGGHLAAWVPRPLLAHLVPLGAFGGALGACALVRQLTRIEGRTPPGLLLLAGIAVNALAGALTGLLSFTASDAQLRSITFWSLGSLGGASWSSLPVVLLAVGLPSLALWRLARPLDALLLGEAEAGHLGVEVERVRSRVITLVALVVGAAVSMSGVIGFVGLIVPHLLRLVMGAGHRRLVPAAALLGASLLLLADLLARTLAAPAELPLGVLTAILGAPLFLGLLARERGRLG